MFDHRLAQLAGQRVEPLPVALRGHPDRVAGELFLGEPLRVLAAGLDERVDQRVAVRLVGAGRLHPGEGGGAVRAEVVAPRVHPAQQFHRRGGGVQPHRVADTGVLGGVGRQHQRDPALLGRGVPQAGVGQRDPGHAGGALGVRDVAGQAVGVGLLERERHRDQPAVELRHGHLIARVHRGQAVVVGLPGGAVAGQAHRLQGGHVQLGQVGHVPGLVVAARARARRAGAARGEHRH